LRRFSFPAIFTGEAIQDGLEILEMVEGILKI